MADRNQTTNNNTSDEIHVDSEEETFEKPVTSISIPALLDLADKNLEKNEALFERQTKHPELFEEGSEGLDQISGVVYEVDVLLRELTERFLDHRNIVDLLTSRQRFLRWLERSKVIARKRMAVWEAEKEETGNDDATA